MVPKSQQRFAEKNVFHSLEALEPRRLLSTMHYLNPIVLRHNSDMHNHFISAPATHEKTDKEPNLISDGERDALLKALHVFPYFILPTPGRLTSPHVGFTATGSISFTVTESNGTTTEGQTEAGQIKQALDAAYNSVLSMRLAPNSRYVPLGDPLTIAAPPPVNDIPGAAFRLTGNHTFNITAAGSIQAQLVIVPA